MTTLAKARWVPAVIAAALIAGAVAGCAAVEHPAATMRAGAAPTYFDPGTLDLTKLLPPPPANDSEETRAELEQMLAIQRTRTDSQSTRAAEDASPSIYRLADALGNPPGFKPGAAPLTDALFKKILATETASVAAAKKHYARPRPFVLEPQLQPVIRKPPDGSYPSGHSSWVRSVALVLADMIPEKRAELLERANEYARNRVVAGVHYPSDIEAGKLAGTAIATRLYASDDFRRALAAATAELRQVLNLPAHPTTDASVAALAERQPALR